ncbi:uncharacterized protein L203_104278 [Cryptococcus depauperatus CBS 7841]|uniref:Uncharacterized protein n=1 Tax=Cryptococcus depauperatus CBS 7841 TaxID=1295531 RepID=A0AAJ8JV78_9TREE
MTFRDSIISNSSSTSYPSTMSSLSLSALGLTDSPLPGRPKTASPAGSPSLIPPRQQNIRTSASKSSLRQEVTTNAASRIAQQRSTEYLRPTHDRQQPLPNSKEDVTTALQPFKDANIATRYAASVAKPSGASQTVKGAMAALQSARSSKPAMVVPVASPQSKNSMADEWEAELVKDAQKLSLGSSTRKTGNVREKVRQIQGGDSEWERFGQEKSSEREAEDQARRGTRGNVAYPPTMPRTPIRAVNTGVTSVHVGVRPRLHPSRASESMLRNQPDLSMPAPLFSPATAYVELPADENQSNYNGNKYESDLLQKAQKEYEQWLAKKAEREGGMEGAMQDWKPQGREIARPSGLSPSSATMQHMPLSAGQSTQEERYVWAYPHTPPDAHDDQVSHSHVRTQSLQQQTTSKSQTKTQSQYQPQAHPAASQETAQQYDHSNIQAQIPPGQEAFYAHSAYWDPSYWWGMYGDANAMSMIHMDPSQKSIQHDESGGQKEGELTLEELQAYEMTNNMMYGPYQWGGMMGQGMMGQGMMGQGGNNMGYPGAQVGMQGNHNPYAMMARSHSTPAQSQPVGTDESYKPFDPSKMKQSRLGHYGYLDGRELAGPPVGHVPAGIQPGAQNMSPQNGKSAVGASFTENVQGSVSGWGYPAENPRARYDGAASGIHIQADLDTPYIRDPNGGGTSAWTTGHGSNGSTVNNGRLRHGRLREGKV